MGLETWHPNFPTPSPVTAPASTHRAAYHSEDRWLTLPDLLLNGLPGYI